MADMEITLGEIARRLDRQEETLGEIRSELRSVLADTRRINGSVAEHRAKLQAHDLELRDLKQRDRHGIVIPIDGKTIAALLLALGTIVAALATAWLQAAG